MNMVMFDLQAAVMAASAGGGIPVIPNTDGSGEGISFSEVLAAQAGNTAAGGVQVNSESTVPDEGYVVPEEYLPADVPAAFKDVLSLIEEKMDSTMQKGMKMLFNTMMKAVQGSFGGSQEKKIDLFSIFYDGSASLMGEDEDMFLLCGALMSNVANAIANEQEKGTDEDEILEALKETLKRMYGTEDVEDEDDEDEDKIPVDILAALIHSPMSGEELEEFAVTDKSDIVENVKELFAYPKQFFTENDPEKAEKMESLLAEYKPAEKEIPLERHEAIQMSFSGVKVNNASEQIETISGVSESEAAGSAVMPQFVQTVNEVPEFDEEEFDVYTYEPIEDQITETISDKLFDITDENGTEELIMVLKPENLGQVAIRLVKENGAVSVTLSAQHPEVGRMMSERAAELNSSLESRDVDVKSVEVVNPSNAAAQMGLDFTNQGFSRRQEYSSEGNRSSYRGIQAISETDETEETEDIKIREAKLWAQA